MDDLIERLRERAAKVRQWIASSQRVVDLLQPEMDKFDTRTAHDIYTVRMSVDHQSSIRTQTKEAEELEAAAARIAELEAMLEPDFAPLTNAALRARIATLEALVKEAGEALERNRQGWANAVELALLPSQHWTSALELVAASAATLARIKENSRD